MEDLEQNQLQQPAVEEPTPPPVPQPATQSLTPEPKPKNPYFLPILLSLVILLLGGGLVFAYFRFLKPEKAFPQVSPSPEVSPPLTQPNIFTILGLDLTIGKALRVEQEGEKDLLVLTVTFEGNEKCQGKYEGQTCGYSAKWFKLKDKEGFVLDQPKRIPSVSFLKTNPLTDRVLAFGEKSQGDVFFEIPKDKDVFLLTYTDNLGKETTGEVEIIPEFFDPTADWEIYNNEEYAYLVKYPAGMRLFEIGQSTSTSSKKWQAAGLSLDSLEIQMLGYENKEGLSSQEYAEKNAPNIDLYDKKVIDIDGKLAYKYSFFDTTREKPFPTQVTTVTYGSKALEIVGINKLGQLDFDIYDLMLQSIKFTE